MKQEIHPGLDARAWLETQTPPDIRRVLDAVIACPSRGGVVDEPLAAQECDRCGERHACASGLGRYPGRVTLAECVACRWRALGMS